jgi:Xaa-Pro aminopeptidase
MSKDADRPEYALFSRQEMDRRYAHTRKLMAETEIDALLVSGEENFQYFAGAAASLALHGSLTRPSVFILPLDRPPIIVTQGTSNLSLGCYVDDIRDYKEVLSFPIETLRSALANAVSKGGRVGVELGHETRMGIPVGGYISLVETFGDVKFVDGADIFIRLRMTKSEEELVYLRQSADITSRARQRLFDIVAPGMTERDIARWIRRLILEEGGDDVSFVILQCGEPGGGNAFHYDRPLQRGDLLAVDTGARVGMYTIDFPRTASLGPPSENQVQLHKAALEANQVMVDALKPGVTCAELHRIGSRAIQKLTSAAGESPPPRQGRLGHGQGLLLTEPPSIAEGDQTVLEPGMVISTEPGVQLAGQMIIHEDVFVITDSGSDALTSEPDELREIPF